MLDRKFIVENADRVKQNCASRGVKCDVDRLVELETARRQKLHEVEELNRKANEIAKTIGQAKDSGRARGHARRKAASSASRRTPPRPSTIGSSRRSHAIQATIPNLTHPDAPIGGEQDSREVTPRHSRRSASSTSSRSITSRWARSWACSTSKPGRGRPATASTS